MLKNLLILALLLAVFPVQAQSGAPKTSQRANDQQPAPEVTSTANQKPASAAPQSEPKQQHTDEIRVIVPPSKDFWDKAAVCISGLLAIVAIFGIYYAAKTLGTIKRQAELMETHAGHMAEQVAVMKAQAEESRKAVEKTLVLQFRPKIIVRGGAVQNGEVVFWLTNVGGTRGTINEFVFNCFEEPSGNSLLKGNSKQISEPLALQPGEARFHCVEITKTAVGMGVYVAGEGENFYCNGVITYTDDLGIKRMTGISRKFNKFTDRFERRTDTEWDYAD